LQVSCDTYFYRVADVLGIDPIARVGRALGLGSITNLGVVGEVPGVMPDAAYHDRVTPGGYQKGMALNTAIGQGDVNVTPLQLAVVYSAIANGGAVYQPQVVSRIESPEGKVLTTFGPKLVRQVEMTPEQHKLLIAALVSVVNEPGGTATRSRLTDVVMAGKTGTAQVAKLGAVRLKTQQMDYWERDHAWFAAFAPAEDPEITVVVLNEHGGHGGSDAAPTAAAVVKKYFELKGADGLAFGPGYVPPASRTAPPPVPKLPRKAPSAIGMASAAEAPPTLAVSPGPGTPAPDTPASAPDGVAPIAPKPGGPR
jgi:penicillin-binding protein 2